ncbi:MAG: toxin FitB [Bacteroidota bacterium]|nr:toxin FitB [Bacteroidota bacterium]
MKYLLDTCVVSELIKPDYNEKVYLWLTSEKFDDIGLSVISIGEIWKGIQKLPESAKKNKLIVWFENDVVSFYYNRIIPIDFDIMIVWGELHADIEKKGKKMPISDSLLAATALTKEITLVTRNTKDFINSGCKLFNPWD